MRRLGLIAPLTVATALAALDTLARLLSAEALSGRAPLGPQAWGQFLAYARSRAPQP